VVAKGTRRYDELMEQQYAYSSHHEDMAPLYIILPKDEEDIIQVLRFAAKKDYRVAVRTGGHQYSGASSVSPKHGGCAGRGVVPHCLVGNRAVPAAIKPLSLVNAS